MIFSPIEFRNGKKSGNRLAVAPMTTQQSQADGTISQEETDWLTRLSKDGYGIVISCAASISDTATAFYNQLSLAHPEYLPGLKRLAADMKLNGSLNIIQLCHAGSRALEALTGEKPHSASSYQLPMIPDFVPPLALSRQQIKQIANDFAQACIRVEEAGFDGVELHGANGYLFTQFISTMTNLRSDEYGGDLENRARFAREVVSACRSVVSNDFIIGFRLSFESAGLETGLNIDENIQITNWLAEDGIDYMHTSQLDYATRSVKYPEKITISYLQDRIDSRLPLLAAGGINSRHAAQNAMDLGADVVAIGRAAIGNKNVPAYFKNHLPLPHHPPFTASHLRNTGISEAFINYIQNAPPLRSLNIVA